MLYLDIKLEYKDPNTAQAVFGAIFPDNGDYVDAVINDRVIGLRIKADNAGTLRNTADDLLACVKTAEASSGLVSGSAADLDGDALLE